MKYFYPKLHNLHKPTLDLSDGLPGYKHLEVASRVDDVLAGASRAFEAEVVYVEEFSDKEVRAIHDDDYVDFLLDISKKLEGDEEYIPPIFRDDLSESPLYFQGGMFCTEIGTPIGAGTIKAALNSAHTALNATKYMLETKESSFVLTRPPGHHAGKHRYGGYCFFNNAYLAAQKFVDSGKKVAVIDIDYHIGDGSLEFATEEMPYFSLHANTKRNYPYLDKNFRCENPYVFLEEFITGIDGKTYTENVRALVQKALQMPTDVIVLSMGFDTLESDYTQDEYIYVKPEDYRAIGALFGSLKQEVMILLEGGYDGEYLSLCATNFMSGFREMREL